MHSIVFERSYGIRTVGLPDGEVITTISQPDWQQTIAAVKSLGSKVTGFITTPELITTADVPLAELSERRQLLTVRIEEAKVLSGDMPRATLLLGSAAFRHGDDTLYNAVLFLNDGEEVGRTAKTNPLSKLERQFLPPLSPPEVRKPLPSVLNVICSDLLAPPPIDAEVNTLLVSACWGVPVGYSGVAASPDKQHLKYIRLKTEQLFQSHPALQTIIMTDRAPLQNPAAQPFNFVANR